MSDYSNSGSSESPSAGGPATPTVRPGLISSGSAPVGNRVSEVWAETAEAAASAPAASAAPANQPTIRLELSPAEARVLGAMVEKSFLTPDVYPMTTNALATACNQKTNRDPVVDYAAVLIDTTLMDLRQRNLVRRVHSQGSRSTKHRQTLDEVLALNEQELALLSVLLLRGPQTMGELRLRTERHEVGFDDLDAVDHCLEALANRAVALVEMLPRQPGHKENRWQHLLGAPQVAAVQSAEAPAPAPAPAAVAQVSLSSAAPAAPAPADRAVVPPSVSVLSTRVAALEVEVATLRRQLGDLAAKLGEPLD